MRGVAKWFNTEQDIINCMAVDKEATKARLRELLDGRFAWFPDKVLKKGAAGIEDDTHKVVTMRAQDGRAEERWQYELREDENAWIFRIGLTVEKINELLEA